MPMRLNVGLSQKVGDNNYGSRGGSVNVIAMMMREHDCRQYFACLPALLKHLEKPLLLVRLLRPRIDQVARAVADDVRVRVRSWREGDRLERDHPHAGSEVDRVDIALAQPLK